MGGLDPITLETAWGLSDVERDGMLTLGMGFRLREGIFVPVESYAYTLTCYMYLHVVKCRLMVSHLHQRCGSVCVLVFASVL